MLTYRQIFVVFGLVFEIASVVYGTIETHHFFKSKPYKYDKKSKKWIVKKYKMPKLIGEDQKKPIEDQIADAIKNWLFALILLVIGVVLQGIAEFV